MGFYLVESISKAFFRYTFEAQKAPLALGVVSKLFEPLRVSLPIVIGVIIGVTLSNSFSLRLSIGSPLGGGMLSMEILFAAPKLVTLTEVDVERDWAWAA